MTTRGPQVMLEGYARTVARGGGGKTMRDNIQAMDALVSAGLVADGNAVDGSSRTGAEPYDVVVAQFPHEPLKAWEIPAPLLGPGNGVIDALSFGVAADGVTDDTVSLQAAINAAQPGSLTGPGKLLRLPSGVMLISNTLQITKPITIAGVGPYGSVISLAPGMTVGAFSVSLSKDVWTNDAYGQVMLANFQITSPNRLDPISQYNAHGLVMLQPANPQTVRILLDAVVIKEVPGDGIHCVGSFFGYVEARNCEIGYVGGYGINANSSTDWTWTQGTIYGSWKANVFMSNCNNWRFNQVNIFVGQAENVYIANTNVTFVNCVISNCLTTGNYITNGNAREVFYEGCLFFWSGRLTDEAYSDIFITHANTGYVYLSNCVFWDPAVAPLTRPDPDNPGNTLPNGHARYNIEFDSGSPSTMVVYLSNTTFRLGPVNTAGITNIPKRLVHQAIDGAVIGGITPAAATFATVTIGGDDYQGAVNLNLNSGTDSVSGLRNVRQVRHLSSGSNRWGTGISTTLEGAGNTGVDYFFNSFDNNGTYMATPLSIVRSSGVVKIGQGKLNIAGAPTSSAGLQTGDIWINGGTVCVAP